MKYSVSNETLNNLRGQILNIHQMNLMDPYSFNYCTEEVRKPEFYIEVSNAEHLPRIENNTRKMQSVKEKLANILSQKFNNICTPSVKKLKRIPRSKVSEFIPMGKALNFVIVDKANKLNVPYNNIRKQIHSKALITRLHTNHAGIPIKEKNMSNRITKIKEIIKLAKIDEVENSKKIFKHYKPSLISLGRKHYSDLKTKTYSNGVLLPYCTKVTTHSNRRLFRNAYSLLHTYKKSINVMDDSKVIHKSLKNVSAMIRIKRSYGLSENSIVEVINQFKVLVSLNGEKAEHVGIINLKELCNDWYKE